jgi:transposase
MSRTCLRCGITLRDTEHVLWCPGADCPTTTAHERPARYEGSGAAHPCRPIVRNVHFRSWEEFEEWQRRKEAERQAV